MILTPARAGIARSGATRSGYPIAQGKVLPLFALSNVARSGATRSNYHSKAVFFSIGGAYDTPILWDGASIHDVLNETPTTASFTALTMNGVHPSEGQDVIITLGSKNNLVRLFGGQIIATTRRYEGKPSLSEDDLRMIDYTWGLERRQVRTRYIGATVGAIVADLIATYAPGYTIAVAPDIAVEVIDEITFTETTLPGCLTQLTRRVGGSWQCDYRKVVRVFFEDTATTNPTILNAVHRSLYAFASTRDLSQIVTRVYVEGGGVTVAASCAVGETIIPLSGDPGWYAPTGGTVVSGPQRLTYASVAPSSGGGLVGPGAAPSGAPVATLTDGAGIESGEHKYAVTFTTASGESVAGPVATITVGAVAAPPGAPTIGTPIGGVGPEVGTHGYAVTFVTASGETTAGPTVSIATGLCPAPTTMPGFGVATPAKPGVGAGPHEYAVTFVNANGETTPGPISVPIYPGTEVLPPSTMHTYWFVHPGPGGPLVGGYRSSAYTFVTAAGESKISPLNGPFGPYSAGGEYAYPSIPTGPAGVIARKFYRTPALASTVPADHVAALKLCQTINDNTTVDITDTVSDSALGAPAPTSWAIPLSAIEKGPPGTTGRRLYRRSSGAADLKLVTTITNNTSTTYTDTMPNASLGAAPPTVNTATMRQIPLTAIPIGAALVTGRRIYRTAANASQLKLLVNIPDNVTTTMTDSLPDASLGVNVPTVTTAAANRVNLTAIPIGAAAVTSRKLYRTAAGGSQLKFLTTLADNTTTTYTDSASFASLGANVPIADTSNLQQPSGNVNPGATSIQVANIGPFPVSGWAVIGNGQQTIRYTGITGNSLTGIPASGPGAIVASIAFNSTVTAAPSLLGIPASGLGAIRFPLLEGDDVNLFVQVDDVPAQLALAALIGGDGIQEASLQDRRLSLREATARGEAHLALRRDVSIEVQFQTRDINTRAGRTIPINLGAPFHLVTELLIQQVTITFTPTADPRTGAPRLMPLYTATASSVRFIFEDLLRAIRKAA